MNFPSVYPWPRVQKGTSGSKALSNGRTDFGCNTPLTLYGLHPKPHRRRPEIDLLAKWSRPSSELVRGRRKAALCKSVVWYGLPTAWPLFASNRIVIIVSPVRTSGTKSRLKQMTLAAGWTVPMANKQGASNLLHWGALFRHSSRTFGVTGLVFRSQTLPQAEAAVRLLG